MMGWAEIGGGGGFVLVGFGPGAGCSPTPDGSSERRGCADQDRFTSSLLEAPIPNPALISE